jgi:lactoylglutathione lyase
MGNWEKRINAINLVVGDLEASKHFHQDVFGLPLQHEDDETAMSRFTDTYSTAAPSADARRLAETGVGQYVIFVDDVDAVKADLDEHGVTVIDGPADRDWGMRTLTVADPGGYTWEITQRLSS